ncbi:hypothetical protein EBS43_02770 [bacterium]|nr:hypothetical protein [bacterium]
MVLMRIPLRLRCLVYSLLLSVPVIAWEVALVSRAPTWDLPWKRMAYGSLAFTLVTIPIVAWLLSLKRWAWYLACALASLWTALSLLLSFRMNYPNLTLYTVCFSLVFFCQLLLILREMNQSFLNPEVNWYQGLPEFLPVIECQVAFQNKKLEMRASRFDLKGVFLFPSRLNGDSKKGISQVTQLLECRVELRFRNSEMWMRAKPIAFMPRSYGIGLEWIDLKGDLKKDLGDLKERLRGEGYV